MSKLPNATTSRRSVLTGAAAAVVVVSAPALALAADHPDRALLDAAAEFHRVVDAISTLGDEADALKSRVLAGIPDPDWAAFVDRHGDLLFEGVAIGADEAGRASAAEAWRAVRAAVREKAAAREAQISAALSAAGYDALDARERALEERLCAVMNAIREMTPRTVAGCAALARFAAVSGESDGGDGRVIDNLADALEALAGEAHA